MAKATTTTYLEIESIGADKLMTTMAGLQKSMNFVAGQLKDLNKGLGISSANAKEGAKAIDAQAKAAAAATVSATQLRVAIAQQAATTSELAGAVDKLTKAHAEQQKKANSLDWTALKSKVDLAAQAYSMVKDALVGLGQEALKMAQAWQVQEQAELRLEEALARNGIGGSIDSYKEWAKAIQAATTYGDEYVLTLAAQAARFARTDKDTQRATEAALSYASATGGDAAAALTAMGRALGGNARSLQSLGIYLDDVEQKRYREATQAEKMSFLLAKLEAQYDGFSEAIATTPIAVLTQAQNILGDIYEEVGRLVSPALYAGLSVVKDCLAGQLDAVNAITGSTKDLETEQDRILSGLETALEALIDLKTAVTGLKNGVEILAGAAWTAISSPLKPLGMLLSKMAEIELLPQSARQTFADLGWAISAPFDMAVDGIKADVVDIKKALAEGEALKKSIRQTMRRSAAAYYASTSQRGGKAPTMPDTGLLTAEPSTTQGATKSAASAATDALDAQMTAYLDYEQKLLVIQADFAAKRKALESSTLIDYQAKLEYKQELDKQEQESLRQTKLDYARATGDELAILEDQYRQERMRKEAEATKALEAEQMATMQKLADNLKSVSNLGVDMLTGWIEGTGDWRAQLYDALKSFSKNLMTTAIASIIDQALVNQAKAQGSQANIPIVGPILALAAGAAMFATTMALKSKLKPAEVKYASGGYISAGMVRGGAWGRDSVPALLEPGERVLSKKETEAYDSAQSRAVVQNITINVSGQLSTPAQITDTVRRVLVPELKAAARAGYAI